MNSFELKVTLYMFASRGALHLCLNWFQTDYSKPDIHIKDNASEDDQKIFFLDLFLYVPVIKFALPLHNKRWMSFCSFILDFDWLGASTLHQSVHPLSMIHTVPENSVMPLENTYW